MRKFVYLIIISIVLTIIFTLNVSAEESLGYIEIKANVPEDFDRSIMINFFSESAGHNTLFTINSSNQYQLKEKLPVGDYRLDFISVYGDNGQFKIDSNKKDISIAENSVEEFSVTITKSSTYKEININEAEIIDQEGSKQQSSVVIEDAETSEQKSFLEGFYSNSFTVFLVIVLGIIYLIIKYRKVRYENE